jgi:hypothetical protein
LILQQVRPQRPEEADRGKNQSIQEFDVLEIQLRGKSCSNFGLAVGIGCCALLFELRAAAILSSSCSFHERSFLFICCSGLYQNKEVAGETQL